MLLKNVQFALRHLAKRKFFVLINLAGLALGMACCLIITLFIIDELSFDRFHEKGDRIYRLSTHAQLGENTWNSTVVSPAVGPVIVDEIPEVEASVRLDQFDNRTVQYEDRVFIENNVLAADGDFFRVFTFPLIEGDPNDVLTEPNSVAITRDIARKYFETEQAVIGKVLTINGAPYQVKGLLADVPHNGHFHFDIVFSFHSLARAKSPNWSNSNSLTYILLEEEGSIDGMEAKLGAMQQKHSARYREIRESGFSWVLSLTPLWSIHLHSHLEDELEPNGDIRTVYFFAIIAIFILLIAGINFMNLSTAKSADRAKEIGIRKTLGAARPELIRQLLAESVLIAFVALFIALGITELLKIPFEQMAGRVLTVKLFENPALIGSVFLITILVGMAAGIYPAFYLTRFLPVDVLKGRLTLDGKSGLFRNSLVVFQFVISIGLIACTLIISRQLEYMRSKDLGFDRENVILLKNAKELGANFESFLQSIKQDNRIISAGYSDFGPLGALQGSTFLAKGKEEREARIMNFMRIDEQYLPTMGIELLAGRNFSIEAGTDSSAMILNEAAARNLGLEAPVVDKIVMWGNPFKVIAVVRDYHFASMHEKIEPLVLLLAKKGNVIEVRVNGTETKSAIDFLNDQWITHTESRVPMQYNFLDADFEVLFHAEERLGNIFMAFTLLAIFIASLGLLALTAFMTERRTKEIGIRKVLGADITSIVLLFSKEFTKLVILAFFLAVPLTYWLMNQWLADFSYRIEVGFMPFVITGLLAIMISWLTVGFHSVKAAMANPIEALRDE